MRKYITTIIFLFSFVLMLAGCSEKTPPKTPPIPKVISGKTEIPVIQSSYSWGGVSADYSGKPQLKGKTPTVVTPEAKIQVSFDYKPAPNQISVQQFQDNKPPAEVPFNNGYFTAPKEKGVYYYGLSAFWTTNDGKHSNGDTSTVFAIEIK